MTAANASVHHSLQHTPTWALAAVIFLFITVSIALDHSIHVLTNWLKRRQKHALTGAVMKLKSELMLLGLMSLLLAGIQSPISDICIPPKVSDVMLPCRKKNVQAYDQPGATSDPCSPQGKVSLMTQKSMQQLRQFIFVIAVMQIIYSVLTMALGRAKMRLWKEWEKESQTTEYKVANDPERFRLTRQTTFARRHVSTCTETSVQLWIKCFFRQLFNPVAKVDYLTLRHGFISAHFSGRNSNFNFQEYIQRSLDEDLKIVVSISPLMWFIVVIFMLVDVHGWNVLFWVSFVPLLVLLILGTKLEVIVAQMALRINNQNTVIKGTPLVQPNDELFWFGRPRFVLTLLHFTLFMNAFELAFFIWVSIQFGLGSCYHEQTLVVITRIVLPITVQVLCSYTTLPLYALVSQIGSQFKGPILADQVAKIMKKWHADVRERRKKQELVQSPRASLSTEWSSKTGSPSEFSSFPRPSLTSNETIQLFNRGDIIEEHGNIVKVAAGTSLGPSQPIIPEKPMKPYMLARREISLSKQVSDAPCNA